MPGTAETYGMNYLYNTEEERETERERDKKNISMKCLTQ